MELRPANRNDIDYTNQHAAYPGKPMELPETIDHVVTIEDDGIVLATGGFKMINEFSAFLWMRPTDHAMKNHKIVLFRVIRDWIAGLKFKRLMAYVEPDFDQGIRLVQHLGFKRESTMEAFFGDKDGLMFVRIA